METPVENLQSNLKETSSRLENKIQLKNRINVFGKSERIAPNRNFGRNLYSMHNSDIMSSNLSNVNDLQSKLAIPNYNTKRSQESEYIASSAKNRVLANVILLNTKVKMFKMYDKNPGMINKDAFSNKEVPRHVKFIQSPRETTNDIFAGRPNKWLLANPEFPAVESKRYYGPGALKNLDSF